jgi:hypothetical protein
MMIWIEIEFRREGGKSIKKEATFDRAPIPRELLSTGGLLFSIDTVTWTVRLDDHEIPVGVADCSVIANYIGEVE